MPSRFTVVTTKLLDTALEEIRRATGRRKLKKVIRDALDFYILVIQSALQGKRVYIGGTRESSDEVQLPQLVRIWNQNALSNNKDKY